jgi:hypothetical protein
MRFEVLMVVMLMMFFWSVTPCGFMGRNIQSPPSGLKRVNFSPEDEDSMFL